MILLPFLQDNCKTLGIEMKTVKFANSTDLDEVAHDEPPHLDLHCLLSRH